MKARLEAEAPKIAEELGLKMEIEVAGHFDPVTFDEGCVKAIREAAERLGYSHRDIVSGAGHDACWINRVAPTAMVMCPCVGGLSHNEAEEISKEWAAAGRGCAVPRGGRDGGDRGVGRVRARAAFEEIRWTQSRVMSFAAVAGLLVISPGPNGVLIAKTVPTSGKLAGFASYRRLRLRILCTWHLVGLRDFRPAGALGGVVLPGEDAGRGLSLLDRVEGAAGCLARCRGADRRRPRQTAPDAAGRLS